MYYVAGFVRTNYNVDKDSKCKNHDHTNVNSNF